MDPLSPERTALVLLDLQNAIISDSEMAPDDADALGRLRGAVEGASRALEAARNARLHVVHVRIAFTEGYPEASPHSPITKAMQKYEVMLEGDPATDFHPDVSPQGGEYVVTKHAISAFEGTDLDRYLHARGVTTVVLAGLVTHFAVQATAFSAHDRAFRTVVLEDGVASATPIRHEAALVNMRQLVEIASTDDFVDMLVDA